MKGSLSALLAAIALSVLAVPGCHDGGPAAASPSGSCARAVAPDHRCTSKKAGIFGVRPLGNKTKQSVQTDGTEDLLMTAMSDSGCFTVVERDKLAVLIEEMKLCGDANPDKDAFDCKTFAQKGHLLGVSDFVVGDVTFFENDVKGAELAIKLPGIGGIDAARTYGAMSINLRVIDVETAKVKASTVVNTVVPSDRGGLSFSKGGGFDLKATAYSNTPQGCALQDMIVSATEQLTAAM